MISFQGKIGVESGVRYVGSTISEDTQGIQNEIKRVEEEFQQTIPWWADAEELKTYSLAEVELRAPRFIVRDKNGDGLLPEGLSVISGDPKSSKSTTLRAFLSVYSSGQEKLECNRQGECLILTFEDDPGSVQLPDVLANGGNPWRFKFPDRNLFKCSLLNMRQAALAPVAKYLSNHPECKVVVVDVLSGILAKMGINSNSAEKARSVLEPLHKLGMEFGVAVVVLHHNHKGTSANAIHKLAGSIQVVASARLVWMVARHPENESLRVIKPVGGNIRGHSKGLVFAQQRISLEEGLEKARKYGIATSGDLSKLEFYRTYVTDEKLPETWEGAKGTDSGTLAEECAAFIASRVEAEGQVGSAEIETECLKKWSKGTYERARSLLNDKGFRTVRSGRAWYLTKQELGEPESSGWSGIDEANERFGESGVTTGLVLESAMP